MWNPDIPSFTNIPLIWHKDGLSVLSTLYDKMARNNKPKRILGFKPIYPN